VLGGGGVACGGCACAAPESARASVNEANIFVLMILIAALVGQPHERYPKLACFPVKIRTLDPQRLSGGGLVFLALSITFVGIDWFMSLNPDFYSTMFGFLFMNYLGLAGLAFTIIMAAYLRKAEPMRALFQPSHFADYGKLLLAFVMMWAYFQFSQYLLVYQSDGEGETFRAVAVEVRRPGVTARTMRGYIP